MDRKSRRKPPPRRKRIQLDDLNVRKSPDKEPATSASAGKVYGLKIVQPQKMAAADQLHGFVFVYTCICKKQAFFFT